MTLQTIPFANLAGLLFTSLTSVVLPLVLWVLACKKWQERPNSLIAGSGGFVIFALILEQSVNSIVLNAAVHHWRPSSGGTAGGIGRLRDWIGGRGVLVGNADAYLADPDREAGKDIAAMLDGWSGDTVRMLTLPVLPGDTGGFSGRRFAGFSLLPWRRVRELRPEPSDLVRLVWRPAEAAGELELIGYDGVYIDTGTPADYLRANLHAAAGATLADPSATVTGTARESVIGAGATVAGQVTRCVVWPGATVEAGESLTDAVRAPGDLTVALQRVHVAHVDAAARHRRVDADEGPVRHRGRDRGPGRPRQGVDGRVG